MAFGEEDCAEILQRIGNDVFQTLDNALINAYRTVVNDPDRSDVEKLRDFLTLFETHVKFSSTGFVDYSLAIINNLPHEGRDVESARLFATPLGPENLQFRRRESVDLREMTLYGRDSAELNQVLRTIASIMNELPPQRPPYR